MMCSRTLRGAVALLIALAVGTGGLPVHAREGVPDRDYWPTEGWRTAEPAERGLDPALLEEAGRRVATEWPLISSLVVVQGGYVVHEQYTGDLPPDEPIMTWSVTKSVTNVAVGIAVREELISDLDQTLGELIPDRIPAGADPRVADISIRHLLTMTAGWAWDSQVNFARTAETDDLDLMLTRQMACDPGDCFEYDSGASNVLAYVVQALSGELMVDYLQPRLFDPLGIAPPEWVVTEDGANRGGGGIYLTARDMAKIGYLYLNEGVWDGQRIVGRGWVERSTTRQSSGDSHLSGANIGGGPYGYHWWVDEVAGKPAFAALGYGGQILYVVPDLDLVVATTVPSADAATPELQQRPRPIIEDLIVPAALGG